MEIQGRTRVNSSVNKGVKDGGYDLETKVNSKQHIRCSTRTQIGVLCKLVFPSWRNTDRSSVYADKGHAVYRVQQKMKLKKRLQ